MKRRILAMNTIHLDSISRQRDYYKQESLACLAFWQKNGFDPVNGGFYTCLERNGTIFSTDKSVWAQGRGLWIFAKAYQVLEPNPVWLEMCEKTLAFITGKCFDTDGRMFFSVTATGVGIQKRRYWFSEAFAAIGAIELYKITKKAEHLDLARRTFDSIVKYYHNPWLLPPKFNPKTVNTKALAPAMIILSTAQIMREGDVARKALYDQEIAFSMREIIQDHYHKDKQALFENVGIDGKMASGPRGRLVNPGHSIEASWFIMNEYVANGYKDTSLLDSSLEILDHTFEKGWDKLYGGLFYFVDSEAKPCEQIEWDMKLWWPHTEALIAFLMAYSLTGKEHYLERYQMVFEYVTAHFKDPEWGEWYGYLHRDGSISSTLKGNLFKGPFHLPRCLLLNYLLLEKLIIK